MTPPSVSVIVPTYNRPGYHEHLYNVFSSMIYPGPTDLWVYDDSPQRSSFFDWLDDYRVHYLWTPRRVTVGAKRNALVEMSRGDVIMHQDDDDWYSPDYLRWMVGRLVASNADLVKLAVWDAVSAYDGSGWRWDTRLSGETCFGIAGGAPPVRISNCKHDKDAVETALMGYGFSYVYRRQAWELSPFDDVTHGEDVGFVRKLGPLGGSIFLVDDAPNIVLHTLHPQSTSRIYPQTQLWGQPVTREENAADLPGAGWKIKYKAGKTYRVLALLKDFHEKDETFRRAASYGDVLEFVDPASGPKPAPEGYRYVQATIRATTTGATPRRMPPPFSVIDKSGIVEIHVVG